MGVLSHGLQYFTFVYTVFFLRVFYIKFLLYHVCNMKKNTLVEDLKKMRSVILISLGVFVLLNAMLLLYWQSETKNSRALQEKTFLDITSNISDSISDRMDLYTNALVGGRALFDASQAVSREEWRAYANSIDLSSQYPGVQGFGYAEVIYPEELQDYIESVRASGFPDFSVRPEGERDIYTSISYLEPFDIRNQQAFGFDMFSEDTRREAMQKAQDTGQPHMSGRVTLVQEIDQDVQPGFLLYVPHYQKEVPLDTIEDKRSAILGYVYSPFRMDDFMEGILKRRLPVDFAVFDGNKISENTKLYDSSIVPRNFDEGYLNSQSYLSEIQEVSLANNTWTIYFNSLPDSRFTISSEHLRILFLIFGLLVNTVVVLLLFRYLSNKKDSK